MQEKIAAMVVSEFPKQEYYLLKNQVLRASRPITANIAEGFGHLSPPREYTILQAGKGGFNGNLGTYDYGIS